MSTFLFLCIRSFGLRCTAQATFHNVPQPTAGPVRSPRSGRPDAGAFTLLLTGVTAIILDISAIIAIIGYYQEAQTNMWTGWVLTTILG
jgi:hypothetical protein